VKTIRRVILVVLSVLAGVMAYHYVPRPLPEFSHADLMEEVRAGRVHRLVVEDEDILLGESSLRGEFRSPYSKSNDAGFLENLRALGVEVVFETSSDLIP
jgi:hypothetical protein